ncbi:ABC transporter permease [Actinoplanes sp. SE50]|uniref:ABC transporter permease n=1 Tax=unclassified Actinoplanes TaxID=2626549 RepID=UPI00023EE08C|nr:MULTISPECIES: ABC transporter permease [unclassified Actinoplanes]AEV89007.1 Putative peptide permease protein [Actinoplanes sp. SE50/110]ATO87413.1 ABC transporter permease [Actinoplanes sp. SE50]SLM04831.1 ABC-type peptide/nickel transporter, permease component [Actinoplanes sp. SE50/110]
MLAYLIRRLINAVLTLLAVTLVTFGVFFMVPKLTGSDPALLYIGKQADPVAVQGIREKLGLNDPVLVQYGKFVKGLVAGRDYTTGVEVTHCPAPCLGYSFKTDEEVWPKLLGDLPVTVSLAIGAAILWVLMGVMFGVISALRRGTLLDRTVMGVALAGVSLPIYFTGLVALSVFTYKLGWLKDADYTPFLDSPVDWARGLILPWVTLAFLFAATYARLTRANMLETLGEDYVRTARAKGLGERTVIGKHALRSSLTPLVTVFGLDLGALLGGAVLTEAVFNLRGLGYEALNGIRTSDLPIILGVTLFAAFFIVLANLIVDLVYGIIDPRVRLG